VKNNILASLLILVTLILVATSSVNAQRGRGGWGGRGGQGFGRSGSAWGNGHFRPGVGHVPAQVRVFQVGSLPNIRGPLGRFNPFFGKAGTLHRSFFHQGFANSFFSTGGGVRFHGSQLGNNPVPPLGLSPLLPTEALTIFGFDVLSRRQTITIVNITPGFKSPAISLAKVRQSSATVKFLPDW
jgi:hypothetical protein